MLTDDQGSKLSNTGPIRGALIGDATALALAILVLALGLDDRLTSAVIAIALNALVLISLVRSSFELKRL